VLDVGCGTKPYRRFIPNVKYVGIDEFDELNPDFLGSATEIPFKDSYFDSVLCTDVLEHISDPERAVKEIKRVMKNGGYLYMTVPQEWCLHYEPNDYFRFTKYGIRYLLEKNSFEVLTIERIGGVFSLVSQRLIDTFWQFTVDCLKPIVNVKWAERIASALCLPFSLFFYLFGKMGDKIDKRDAIGWAVLARK
jgi:SAM-dependent methyltransferase